MTKTVDELMRLHDEAANAHADWVICADNVQAAKEVEADAARSVLRSALEEVVPTWRPIETAPKDGYLMLLCTDVGIVFKGKFNKHLRIWVDDEGRERFRTVKSWQPLPAPPAGDAAMQQAPEQEG